MRYGLYPKFMLLMVALAVIPVAFAGYQVIWLNESGIQAAVLELQTKLAESLSEELAEGLRTTDDEVQFTLTALSQNLDWRAKQSLLQSFIETHRGTEELAILDAKGQELVKVYDPQLKVKPKLVSHAGDASFSALRREKQRQARLERASPVPRLRLLYPLGKDLSFYVDVRMIRAAERIGSVRVGGSGFAVLVDREGQPVLYPEPSLSGALLNGFPTLPIVKQALKAVAVGASDFPDPIGRMQVGAFAPVPALGAAIVVLQPRQEAYAAAYAMRRRATLVLVVFALLAVVVAWFTAGQLSKPILDLTRGAESVARGDFGAEVKIESDDELRDLAETFNYMTRQLKSYAELQVDRLVTEQRKTEAILFSIADGILMTDYEGRIQLANRVARETLGLPPNEPLEGRFIHELIPDPAIGNALRDILDRRSENQYAELDLSSDTYRKVFRVAVEELVAPGRSAPQGIVAALHDVTLEKELEKLKEDFVHSMTHDLRSPMASIRGFLELLLKGEPGVLTPAQRKMLESMDKASFRLLGMINNILDMAKMRAGRMELQFVRCSLKDTAARVIETMEPLAQRKKLKLDLVGQGEFRQVADPDLLERVFTNLISNAIKFTPDSGRIAIEFADKGEATEVAVADSGPGIPPELLPQIFGKFQQGKINRAGGTGLGLAICKYIVESHHGTIRVESAAGRGARFVMLLPKSLIQEEHAVVVVPAEAAG
jgi:PAS domain S-box-containing protein